MVAVLTQFMLLSETYLRGSGRIRDAVRSGRRYSLSYYSAEGRLLGPR